MMSKIRLKDVTMLCVMMSISDLVAFGLWIFFSRLFAHYWFADRLSKTNDSIGWFVFPSIDHRGTQSTLHDANLGSRQMGRVMIGNCFFWGHWSIVTLYFRLD